MNDTLLAMNIPNADETLLIVSTRRARIDAYSGTDAWPNLFFSTKVKEKILKKTKTLSLHVLKT